MKLFSVCKIYFISNYPSRQLALCRGAIEGRHLVRRGGGVALVFLGGVRQVGTMATNIVVVKHASSVLVKSIGVLVESQGNSSGCQIITTLPLQNMSYM